MFTPRVFFNVCREKMRAHLRRKPADVAAHCPCRTRRPTRAVVHHYPTDHYRHWEAYGVTSRLLAAPGAFGENVTTLGMTEESVCVGDV